MKKFTSALVAVFFLTSFVVAQNVGIGLSNNTTPILRLHVSSITDSNLLLLENRNSLGLQQLTSMYFKTGDWYTGAIKTIGASSNSARLGFFTYSATSINGLKEGMSILDNGNVGINTTAPTAMMDINGSLRIRANGAAAGAVLTSDANGNATWQTPSGGGSSVGFRGRLASDLDITSAAGEATITGFTEEFDDGSGFNGAAGTFTAPSTGVYQFTINLNWGQDVSNSGSSLILTRLYLNRSGSNNIIEQVTNSIPNNTAYSQSQNFSSIYKLNAGDIISIRVDPQVSTTFTLGGNGSTACRFSGVKLY